MPFDIPEESIFVLIFLLISFFNWIAEKVKKSKLEGSRRRPQARRFEEEPPDFQSVPPPTPQRPSSSSEENPMRQILESLGIPVEEAPPVVTEKPPALPSERKVTPTTPPPRPEPIKAVAEDNPWAREKLTPEEAEAMRQFQGGQSEAHRHRHTGISKDVRKLLTAGNTKTAFVLKEILDKPKCFDS